MKKYLILSLGWLLALVLAGCLGSRVEKDYPAAIMVDGAVYYVSVAAPAEKVDEESVVGSITSYTDTFPGTTSVILPVSFPYPWPRWPRAWPFTMRTHGMCASPRMNPRATAQNTVCTKSI